MLKKVLLGLVAVIVVLVAVIATRPAPFHFERSASVSAPPDVVFSFLDDLHRFTSWSPWARLDPAMKTTFGGAPRGVGATYAWTGNDKVGEGRMTITEAKPGERVAFKLEFLKPFAMESRTALDIAHDAAGSRVTWTMDGENGFMGKAFSLFGDMDKMIGKDFEDGLANMKGLAELESKKRAAEAAANVAARAAAAKVAADAAAAKAADEARAAEEAVKSKGKGKKT